MKVGLVSDSHGDVRRLNAALSALAGRGAEAVVHCGDIGSAECLGLLGGSGLVAAAVAGNMDRHPRRLAATAERAGVQFSERQIELDLGGGRHLAATHGHDASLLEELIRGQQFPYVCHGHTHRRRDERYGPVRVINPGALRHPRGHTGPSAAVLDTDADTLDYVSL